MLFPPEDYIKLLAKRGTMLVIENGEFAGGTPGGNHTYVICNDATTDKVVILSVATSRLDKAVKRLEMRGHAYETLVDFGADEYPHFTLPSAFDCNDVYRAELARLAQLYSEGKLRHVQSCDVTPEHMARIEAGIVASTVVVEEWKLMVRTAS